MAIAEGKTTSVLVVDNLLSLKLSGTKIRQAVKRKPAAFFRLDWPGLHIQL